MKEENEVYISALTLSKKMIKMLVLSILKKTRISQLEHLKSFKVHTISISDTTILIGANAPEAVIQSEVKKRIPDETNPMKMTLG